MPLGVRVRVSLIAPSNLILQNPKSYKIKKGEFMLDKKRALKQLQNEADDTAIYTLLEAITRS